jgi:hypothetical protein
VITAHTTWHYRTLGTTIRGDPATGEFYTKLADAEDKDYIEGDDGLYSQPGDEDDDLAKELKKEEREQMKKLREERVAEVEKRRKEAGREPLERKGLLVDRSDPLCTFCAKCTYKSKPIVVDEAQVLRNPDTLNAGSLFQMLKALKFLSATPLLNHVKDARGYLHQIFKSFRALTIQLGFQDMYFKDFDPRRAKSKDAAETTTLMNILPDITEDPRAKVCHDAWDKDQTRLFILDPRQIQRHRQEVRLERPNSRDESEEAMHTRPTLVLVRSYKALFPLFVLTL